MALTDITQRANNTGSGARTPTRQITLFDALSAAQRRGSKRPRRSLLTGTGGSQENATAEDGADCIENKCLKRARAEVPRLPVVSTVSALNVAHNGLAAAPSERRTPDMRCSGLYSIQAAVRARQCQPRVAMRGMSTIGRLASLVSPADGVYRLHSGDNSHIGALPLACKYGHLAGGQAKLALVDEGGMVSLFDTTNSQTRSVGEDDGLKPVARWRVHDNSAFDLEWSLDNTRMVTASADETCRLWDVEQQKLLGMFSGHTQTVRSISWRHGDQHCFSTASRDGSIMMWDLRANKVKTGDEYVCRPVNTISRAHFELSHPGKAPRGKGGVVAGSVTSIKHLCQDANLLASVGSTSEIVKYWDVRMCVSARATALPTPVAASLLPASAGRSRGTSSLSLDPDGTRLYAACNDNRVYVHNALALGSPSAQLEAPEFECSSFNIATSMSPCGHYLAAGSASGNVVVWELDAYGRSSSGRRAVLQGHLKEAGCVAWYPGKERTQLATCGDDGTMRLWDIDAEQAVSARLDPMKKFRWGFADIHQEL
ncbi:hypothetical protein GGI04_005412 [Coemansia thaxteri]|nr:hypothetical protein GGI04_005412 [Coemansia thaxteri]KAJ2468566.1 hypothetical protein GGI02_003664 [Coemansia sp. RSA 2322]